MEITINIPAMDKLAEAITQLSNRDTAPLQEAAPAPVAAPMQQPAAVPMPAPAPTPTPAPATAPTAPTAPAAPAAAPTYTLDELARAAADLMPAHTNDLTALLAQFGVASLGELPAVHYGAFATAIRGMGAKI
ncbi:hypothetical protein [Intestinibacillus massiliensis]|uniref:hypothetical protein n=1 Tax=Intestinibacillus massiliensis TaxID=1871029 RepID=UPI000B34EF22|nr:hypothetical protein [Intestinibacillus massiliensis]